MMTPPITIAKLASAATDADIRMLAALLVDAVNSNAAVSFLAPLPLDAAEAWWRRTLSNADPRAIVLVARQAAESSGAIATASCDGAGASAERSGGEIVGTVQLHPAWAPNQPRRAEVAKLLVHSSRRGAGLGAQLMHAIEAAAAAAGYDLLTLDAKRGGAADRLYRRLGWIHAGTIPDFALDPDGRTPHDAVVFYKKLRDAAGAQV